MPSTSDTPSAPAPAGAHAPRVFAGRAARSLVGALLASVSLSAVCPPPAAAQQASPPSASNVTLDTLEVVSDGGRGRGGIVVAGEDPRGPIQGYVANRSTVGTKTDTPLIRTPQSISVVGREAIDDQKPLSLAEAVRYAPGVRGETFGADTRNDWFLIRGFAAQDVGLFLDGLQLFYSAYASWKLEPFNLERIEILRGPASVLYGGAGPGGILNAVSKRPPLVPIRYVETGVNNFGNAYGAFDIGGPADADGKLFYRFVGLGRAGGTQTDFISDDRYFFAPSITWRPDADTSLTMLAQIQRDKTNGANFLPYEGTVTPAPFGFIKTSRFTGDPSVDRFTRSQNMIGYEFEHRFDNDIKIRQNARYGDVTVGYATRYGGGYVGNNPASADLARFDFLARSAGSQADIDTQVIAPFVTGDFAHTLLGGAEYRRYQLDDYQAFGFGPSLNLLNPVYTNTPLSLPFTLADRLITQNQFALYLQDQITYGDFTLVLSGRHDWISTDNANRIGDSASRDSGAFSGRIGLIYNSPVGLAPYVSYARGFNPLVGVNTTTGQLFRPETSEQTEVGLKYQPAGFDGYFSAALFDLYRANATTSTALFVFSQLGEVRSRGVEVEAVANLMPGLRMVASYTAYDLSVTKDANPLLVGTTPTTVPEQYGSLFLDYTIQSGALRGLGFGGGVRGVGRSFADTANQFAVPGYVVGDLVAHYDWEGWRFAVNVANVSDERFVGSCSTVSGCFYGERRRVLGSIGYRW